MDELDLIISYSNLSAVESQLRDWRLKTQKPEQQVRLDKLICFLSETNTHFRALEKELRVSIQRNAESRLNELKMLQEIERLKKENKELKDML